MSQPPLVVCYGTRTVHYEREPARAHVGNGVGGTTLCAIKFVPRTRSWTRDVSRFQSRFAHFNSCATCLRLFLAHGAP